MRHRLARAALGVVLLAAACGDGPEVPAVDVRDPGAGTGRLLVRAYVKGTAAAPNAIDPSAFRTRLVVRVSRGVVPVRDATVRVNGVTLVHRGVGVYGEPAELAGLPPALVALEVTAGGDWLHGASSSPGLHAFTAPSRTGEVLSWEAGAPLEVAWERAGLRADSAALNVGAFAADGDIDDGAFAIPAGALPAGPAECGLLRENRVRLAGGTAGSLLSVSVWNGLDVALQPR